MEPIISGTMIMFLKWVFTTSGFSLGGASFLASLSFLTRAIGFLFNPLEKRLRARACINSISCSLQMRVYVTKCLNYERPFGKHRKISNAYFGISKSWSRSTPRKVNFLKVRSFTRLTGASV